MLIALVTAVSPTVVLSAPINAAEVYTDAYRECIEQSGASFFALIECNSKELQHQDQLLNIAYHKAMAALSPERRKNLQNAQVLWLKYREANCSLYNAPDMSLGWTGRLNASSCFLGMTADRAKELESFQ
jgi:uncharacterized protein YecT (DUF1311 family)